MALSWNEIKERALKFSNEWANETKERAEKDSFWNDFFNVFGITRKRVASFEEPVKKLGNKQGFIDLFWKGKILIEQKSKGKDLDKAFKQAIDYFPGIKEHDLPKYILVSDFERFRLYDLEEKTEHEFHLKDFVKNVQYFGFIANYQKRTFKEEDPVNIKAALLMGKLHDQLKEFGYVGHSLEVYLVRLLFILFADDTGIFEPDIFKEFVEQKTNEDGSDLGALLAQLFQVLNTPNEKRLKNLDEHLNQFTYINGKLFEEPLPIAAFNSSMRKILLEASGLDWGKISPAIFGSLFQSVMNPEERRNLGAHYTSEKNILKLIKPLFLDELRAEFKRIKSNKPKLKEFHKKLSTLRFLDPACGSGNFLIITYRELRQLEIEILRELFKHGERVLNISDIVWIDVDQFNGIEYDEFASRIAEVAMWLIDHQMNMKIQEEFGQYFARLPLNKAAKIVNGNALRIDWQDVIPNTELSYILGNPPFIGSKNQSKEQKEDIKLVFNELKGSGVLDYVTAWYLKASQLIQETTIKVAFVSTNSITQGEQVSVLWSELINKYGIEIHFAHKTFNWSNEAKNNAAVHVIIVGFANFSTKSKRLFEYENINKEPDEIKAKNISPYLIDANNSVATSRSKPVCNVQEVVRGSETTDSGHFMLSEEEKDFLLKTYSKSSSFVRKFQGGGDVINNRIRWCLWLKDTPISDYRNIPLVMEKIKAVKDFRLSSKKERTRKWADFPTLFSEDRQPKTDFLVIPKVSSERRKYLPIAYLTPDTIINNTVSALANASVFYFGIITSLMHMTWLKHTCGRMKSDYIYSIQIVYNNYPFPKEPSGNNKIKVEEKAQKILDVRKEFPGSSLADLYDPLTMPPNLVKAHQELDKAVDLCYRPQTFNNETARIEFLFDLYKEYTRPMFNE
jgi:MmeI, DNA-methyltransferase domain/MmeI, target recognition domain/MmeI, N-terminal domain/MmeI, C-terminal domain/MmeI, helicase spacer domain